MYYLRNGWIHLFVSMSSTRPTVRISCVAKKQNIFKFNHQIQNQDVSETKKPFERNKTMVNITEVSVKIKAI